MACALFPVGKNRGVARYLFVRLFLSHAITWLCPEPEQIYRIIAQEIHYLKNIGFRQPLKAKTALFYEQIFNIVSKILFFRAQITKLRGVSCDLWTIQYCRLVIASATTVTMLPPCAIKYSKQYNALRNRVATWLGSRSYYVPIYFYHFHFISITKTRYYSYIDYIDKKIITLHYNLSYIITYVFIKRPCYLNSRDFLTFLCFCIQPRQEILS